MFTVVVTFTMAGDTADRDCDGAGSGTFNTATVVFDGGSATATATACRSRRRPSGDQGRDDRRRDHVIGNTYEAVYTVTVTNSGDGPGQYDLDDLPDFGAGANVTDYSIRSSSTT